MHESRRYFLPKGAQNGDFQGADGVRLRMRAWPAPTQGHKARGTLFLVPGRTEYMERYAEVIADFLEKGFAVAILDMRNHGLSGRPLANRQAHFVADFAPMADDVARFVAQGAALDLPRPFTLLGHSMGGHVALRAVHDHPQLARSVDKLVLCAPMLRIRFSPLPLWLVRGLVALAGALGFWERYALGQGDWAGGKARARLMRLLTSDAQRFAVEDWQVAQNPDLKLGGVTWGWLRAALNSCDLLAQKGYAEAITVPTRFILAGSDRVVDNHASRAFAARMPHADVVELPNSRHEPMREVDAIRDGFFKAVEDFAG
ncbi:lysophospholipase [Iodidimonas muriae]|uniref:Lysophospholipase n=2 Tax=Iodidimonas muriae TaxID=261467 RepID=A0ABQ2LE65_9PROT|nr:lysophospholipase [Iodidimonas muriae]